MFALNVTNLTDLPKITASLLDGESDVIANLSNASALIFNTVPNINWAGFYRLIGGVLVLGPFQGKPACLRIPLGKGVCGTAAASRKTVVVDDVNKFSGHIACDSASASEMVVPLINKDGSLFGVLDIDSPVKSRFNDIAGIITLVAKEIEAIL